jgi:membrane-bound lytic murein transglycosylase F
LYGLNRHIKITLLLCFLTLLLAAVWATSGLYPFQTRIKSDLPSIIERGSLRIVTAYNPIGYFLYKDEVLGFEYDLLKAFAESLEIDLEVVIVNDPKDLWNALYTGKGDIMAYHIPVENLPDRYLNFSEPYVQTEQVIVQRKVGKKDPAYIGQWQQMAGKTISIGEGAHYANTLQDLNFELGNKINIQMLDGGKSSEDLIGMVSSGEIDYTIANKEIALINRSYYNNIDIETSITPPQDIAFALHRKHRKLLSALNQFIEQSRANGKMYALYERYFKTSRLFAAEESADNTSKGDFISHYDELIQRHAAEIGWDWRLVTALIWQESRFKPRAKSWAGASGLMQLMPATARRFGLSSMEDIYHPELNIKTGTKYIAWLDKFWSDIQDPIERIKFIIASYNAGEGHVKDAQRLAKKYGYDDNKWNGQVEIFLLNKSQPQFYRDPVCKYGYCRGSEPFHYVRNIIQQYDYYKKTIATDALAQPYNFSLDFAPIYDAGITEQGMLKKRPLFDEKKIFEERSLSRESANATSGNYHNTLQPKSAYKSADTIMPRRPALQERKKLFKEKGLFEK